jgi:uncharacterized protein YjbJ (UPF0337 family)
MMDGSSSYSSKKRMLLDRRQEAESEHLPTVQQEFKEINEALTGLESKEAPPALPDSAWSALSQRLAPERPMAEAALASGIGRMRVVGPQVGEPLRSHLIAEYLSGTYPTSSGLIVLLLIERDKDMDWNRVEGNWKEAKGKIKERWGKLTDDDLTAINGQRDQLEGRLQQRYGYAKDQSKKEVDAWFATWK